RIKRHSAYRSHPVVIEYRWHPLHGQKVPLFRRTGRRGQQVFHIDVDRKYTRELPACMIDKSVCGAMTLGPPQASIAALSELHAVLSSRAHSGGSSKPSETEGTSDEASG